MTLDPSRKLTTIFCADVRSDTPLATNEEALAALKHGRNTMRKLIEARRGRVIKSLGDETIAEFASVVEAVRTAVDVQSELGGEDIGRPGHPQIRFRIGINLGDVMVEGDDIYGEGVNIAARLLSLASPGGIVISSTVHDQVYNKLSVGFDFMGRIDVKNIDGGIAGYLVRTGAGVEKEASLPRRPKCDPQPPQQTAHRAVTTGTAETVDIAVAVLAVIAIVFAAVNLMFWERNFWARWPLLFLVALLVFLGTLSQRKFDPMLSLLGIAGAVVIAINLFAWHGEFWASWPVGGLAIIAGFRWIMLQYCRLGR
jgi:adenylate cyclase